MRNPYLLDEQTAVAFSGGRTSGFMLWNILQAHGGSLPDGVVVCFQNTGLEHEKTLEFIRDVEAKWGVPITWLEASTEYEEGRKSPHTYKVVDFCTA